MSKINQIQKKLLELSGAEYQKLADAFLYKKGFDQINGIGAVAGANKDRKGTPDSLISWANDQYIFVEYTTQQTGVCKKFQDDLNKCFDESKTGISVTKIDRVILCHTSNLSSNDEDALRVQCEEQSTNLDIYGLSAISNALLESYPGIARDFLGINVDTGQVLSLDDFIRQYGASRLATPLDITFHGREDEIKTILESLEDNDLLIVSGKAGVGKTRLALEVCSQFLETNSEYKFYCIFNRGPNIFEDLQVYFSESGNYLILVDDANRVSSFDYFSQLVNDKREGRTIKVISTVRDYAVDSIQRSASICSNFSSFFIDKLKNAQSETILRDEFGIRNSDYLHRINDIANGNPRIAVMAARVACESNQLSSLYDVSSLYETYYGSIQQDLNGIGSDWSLRVCGLICFLRVLDKSNDELMNQIYTILSVDENLFWNEVSRLNALEIVDLYENEVAKISDQVLSTYLFYLSVLKEKKIEFGDLLDNFFPTYKRQFIDTLNPVIDAFDPELIKSIIAPYIGYVWEKSREEGDKVALLGLIDLFWFIKPVESLIFINEEIQNLGVNPTEDLPSSVFLDALSPFSYADESNCKIAIELILDYLSKIPSDIAKVLTLFSNEYGFEHHSYLYAYGIQKTIIDFLLRRISQSDDPIFSKLFLDLAKLYLQIQFRRTRDKGRRTVSIQTFCLTPSQELFALRKTVWDNFFRIAVTVHDEKYILKLINDYISSSIDDVYSELDHVRSIIENDAYAIVDWINRNLEPDNYLHSLVAKTYFQCLRQSGVSFGQQIAERFTNDTLTMVNTIVTDHRERRYLQLDFQAYENVKHQELRDYFSAFDLEAYKNFITQWEIVVSYKEWHSQDSQFSYIIEDIFRNLAERDVNLYLEVLEYYVHEGDKFSISLDTPIKTLFSVFNIEEVWDFICRVDFPDQDRWKFGFYQLLPKDDISIDRLKELYELCNNADIQCIPSDFEYLLKYHSVDKVVLARFVECLLNKINDDDLVSNRVRAILCRLFFSNQVISVLEANFSGNATPLKRAYIEAEKVERHIDYSEVVFEILLKIDQEFLLEYLNSYLPENYGYKSLDRKFSFLWRLENYNKIITVTLLKLYNLHCEQAYRLSGIFRKIYRLTKNDSDNEDIRIKQDELTSALIKEHYQDMEFVGLIFEVVSEFSTQRRKEMLRVFLTVNKDFQDFKRLSLESHVTSWMGSKVPILNKKKEYYQSLLDLFDSVELLQHKLHLQRIINSLSNQIEHAKKEDFIDPF